MAEPPRIPGGWLPPQPPAGPQPQEPPPMAEPQRQGPVFVRAPGEEGTNGLAIAALVSAILSIGLLIVSLGLSFAFSLPLGITGWICAVRARRDVRPGQRKAGLVLAIGAVALSAIAAVVWIALVAAGFSPEELQQNLERELERQRRAGS